jgi:hypothetical protein
MGWPDVSQDPYALSDSECGPHQHSELYRSLSRA